MFNAKNVITFLLILLGATLFYLWYSTWHRNISTNSLNKKLIEENLKQAPSVKLPPKPQTHINPTTIPQIPPSNTPSNISTPAGTPNLSTKPKTQLNTSSNTQKSVNPLSSTNKPISGAEHTTKNPEKTIPKVSKKPNRIRVLKKPIRPVMRKPIVRKPIIQKPKKPNTVQLNLGKSYNTKEKPMKLPNGSYQAGAFRYFSDAVSKSLELQAQGKKTKIVHQGEWYKVIVY